MIINNEHKLCRAFGRFFKSKKHIETWLGLTILAYHITCATAEDRTRDLPLLRRALYHWATGPRSFYGLDRVMGAWPTGARLMNGGDF